MRTCILAYLHTCILAYLHTCILAYLHTCILVYLHTCILAYLHTCIPAYLHTCRLVYLYTCILAVLPRSISGYNALGYLWLSKAISGYLWLSKAISGYLWVSLAISDYLYCVSTIRVQVEAGESKLLLFETFFFLYFTITSCRGARAPKKSFIDLCLHADKTYKKVIYHYFFHVSPCLLQCRFS